MEWTTCRSLIVADAQRATGSDSPSLVRLYLTRPASRALLVVRLGSWAAASPKRRPLRIALSVLYRRACLRWNIEIPFSTRIGPGLHVLHTAGGIVVHPATVIGSNVTLMNSITIGGSRGRAWPVIGDDVVIGAGAVVLGGVTVGDRARIGANAVVVDDVPSGARVKGIPARVAGSSRP